MDKYEIPKGSLISFMSNKVKQFGGINLAQGIPGFQPPKELLRILKDISFDNIHQYAPGNGNMELLNQLKDFYSEYNDFELNNFMITNGATEAISLLYTYLRGVINEKFTVLAFSPAYETYNNLPRIFGNDFIAFDFNSKGGIDFEKLEHTIQNENIKIVFVNSPGNPYGKIWSKLEIENIIELSKKYDFYLIFDSVYKDLYFDTKPYIPLELFNDKIFYVDSFSKMLSITGWRIGYFIGAESHMEKIRNIHDYTGLCTPSVLQNAVNIYLKNNDFAKKYVDDLRIKLKSNFDRLSAELVKLGFYIPKIEGGYFIWAKLPKEFDNGYKFTIDLYEQKKVAVIPGVHFSEKATNYIRFNVAREHEEIEEAIVKLNEFISK